MRYAFSILMFMFSGVIFLYALLLAWTKDITLVRRHYAVKMKDKKRYAVQFAKLLAVVSIAPALAGIAGIFTENVFCAMGIFIIGLIVCIKKGLPLMKSVIFD
ncbi:MAG: hypothetical protein IJ859_09810 [Synergistaceae bacterium]|nr:hypothetical protein [Synergistaceae bacterium]